MGSIKLEAQFNGGTGSLSVSLTSALKKYTVHLNNANPSFSIGDAPSGLFVCAAGGNAPDSENGSIILNISGDINPIFNKTFPAGVIDPCTFKFKVIK